MKSKITIGRDKNGNRIARIKNATGRAFAIQTNGNLPTTHRDGITDATGAEVAAHIIQYGTAKQRAAIGLRPLSASRYYIQRKGGGYLETVDEFESGQDARAMLAEYIMSDPSAVYRISTRPCKAWMERGQA